MEFSWPAWLGGLIGAAVAVAVYIPSIRHFEARLRAQNGPLTLEQRTAFEEKLSIARRAVLGIAVALLATLGYLVGNALYPRF